MVIAEKEKKREEMAKAKCGKSWLNPKKSKKKKQQTEEEGCRKQAAAEKKEEKRKEGQASIRCWNLKVFFKTFNFGPVQFKKGFGAEF